MAAVDWIEWLMSPSPLVLMIGFFVVLVVPIALHAVLTARTQSDQPSVLVVGPCQVGKTAFAHLLEHGKAPTMSFISQVSQTVELTASRDAEFRDNFYKNREDTTGTHTKFLLVDTPGHGKLRNDAMSRIAAGLRKTALRSVVFFVDASALGEQEVLADTAGYLYEVLLELQKSSIKRARDGAGRGAQGVPVLIAANKSDLFTALPGTTVKTSLEAEIGRIRSSKSNGLLDSGVGADEIGSEERDDWLGEYGSSKFFFQQLAEFDIEVDVISGSVRGTEKGPEVEKWWQWIAYRV